MADQIVRSKAYSVLNVTKSVTEDGVFRFSGIASTPNPDRMRDIVEPMGAVFTIPMALLMFHDMKLPVGNVVFAEPNADGIPFEAEIPIVVEPGKVKDRVDEAIHSIKYKLITAVSIGFSADIDDVEWLDNGGMKFNKWNWNELSLVSVPANAEALIEAIKSIDSGRPYKLEADPEPARTRVRVERTMPKGPFKFIE